ncbi:hypothetical protein KY366_05740, partial [Candidatus Woesearchaeota archaeon]|nr:hypothetical protein [Candidatus Woesearchaeota archaeon]
MKKHSKGKKHPARKKHSAVKKSSPNKHSHVKKDSSVRKKPVVRKGPVIKHDSRLKKDSPVRKEPVVRRDSAIKHDSHVKNDSGVDKDSPVRKEPVVRKDPAVKHDSPLKRHSPFKMRYDAKVGPSGFFGRLLIIFIMMMVTGIYMMVVFNQVFVRISESQYWVLYVILGFLSLGLIIFFIQFVLYSKKVGDERRKKKLEKKEGQENKETKPGFFSRLFRRKEKKATEETKPALLNTRAIKDLPKSLKIEVGRYETGIDVLYRIIGIKKRVKLSSVAKYFNISRKKAEELATILQEHGMAEIHYPSIGGAEILEKKDAEKKDIGK